MPDVEDVAEPVVEEIAYPLLLAGMREGARADLVVVGEVGEGGIAPASSASTSAGATVDSEWILFAEGVRVGRLTVDSVGAAEQYCPSTPSLSGTVELVPTASAVASVLALPATVASTLPFASLQARTHEYDERVASLTFAQEAIPRLGAPWPEGGVLATRQHIQMFQPLGTPEPTLAATYVVRDRIAMGPPSTGSYALFILSARVGNEFRETFQWYQSTAGEAKRIPRYFGHLDWDADGRGEVLLDVFGADRRWHAALEQGGGGWVRAFESPCGAVASAAR
jgi:hypothetical protein